MEPPSPPGPPVVAPPPGLPRVAGLEIHRLRYPPGHHLPRHRHRGALICYAVRGGFWEGGPRGTLEAARGAISFQPPGEPHANRVGPRGLVGLRVELAPAWLERRVPGVERRGPGVDSGPAAWFTRSLVRETRHGEGASAAAIESLVILALTEVARSGDREDRGRPTWLRRVRERLDDDFVAAPSLSELAREAGVHPGHLARAFHRHFGCTVGDYVRELRLARASDLLRASDEPLATVALSCGFADQSHLGRAFKHRFGVTPGAFRRQRSSGDA